MAVLTTEYFLQKYVLISKHIEHVWKTFTHKVQLITNALIYVLKWSIYSYYKNAYFYHARYNKNLFLTIKTALNFVNYTFYIDLCAKIN